MDQSTRQRTWCYGTEPVYTILSVRHGHRGEYRSIESVDCSYRDLVEVDTGWERFVRCPRHVLRASWLEALVEPYDQSAYRIVDCQVDVGRLFESRTGW